ncbi:chorismate mutase [Suillus subalutaceus]|uniref:chorismate mutase n=1 Tax=Suillus subalutaceus TaxID=48586 RepID=UPI001B865ED0|nr:chorismate mutase [Suillus subalutaceus]KAG1831421.1 chorismate mutase [Suillus subalutaceus]
MLRFLVALQIIGLAVASSSDFSDKCYFIPLPSIPPSTANRTVPWGEPTIKYANGTTCCSSLNEIRDNLDTIDAQLLQLLSTRASYVREATRFKSTLPDVNDPSRNEQVIQGAVDDAPSVHLPQIVAEMVYEGIINSSVLFEECIFNTYDYHTKGVAQKSLKLAD